MAITVTSTPTTAVTTVSSASKEAENTPVSSLTDSNNKPSVITNLMEVCVLISVGFCASLFSTRFRNAEHHRSNVERFSVECQSIFTFAWFCFTVLCDWCANSRHFLNQWEVRPKPIVTCSHAFFPRFPVFVDWFIALFTSVIGQSNYLFLVLRHTIENRSILTDHTMHSTIQHSLSGYRTHRRENILRYYAPKSYATELFRFLYNK